MCVCTRNTWYVGPPGVTWRHAAGDPARGTRATEERHGRPFHSRTPARFPVQFNSLETDGWCTPRTVAECMILEYAFVASARTVETRNPLLSRNTLRKRTRRAFQPRAFGSRADFRSTGQLFPPVRHLLDPSQQLSYLGTWVIFAQEEGERCFGGGFVAIILWKG